MNGIDIVLGGLILFGAVRGFMKGFFVEVASLMALILGIYGAIHFSYLAGDYLSARVRWSVHYINLAAFAVTFIVIVVVIALAGRLLTKIADFAALGILNRLLGAVFGGLKTALILGIVLAFFDSTTGSLFFVEKETAENSVLYRPVKNLGLFVFSRVLRNEKNEEEKRYQLL
ncbi:MAG: CvpA family protein [Sinomicrobium sp.]|nr:CvpA family protein [Sinomicrobium sp.]